MTKFLNSKSGFGKYYTVVTKTGGIVLFFTGFLILTNQIQVISYFLLNYIPFLTNFG